jgi:hypothetical protein
MAMHRIRRRLPRGLEQLWRLGLLLAVLGLPPAKAGLFRPLLNLMRLVKETDASGKGLAILGELLQKELGPEGERIVKRCVARQLGLPATSLDAIPLRQLTQRFNEKRS